MSNASPLLRRGYRRRPVARKNPTGFSLCQGCQALVYQSDLKEQYEYRGGLSPVPTGVWKCSLCTDAVNPFFMLQVLRPDPEPVIPSFPPAAVVDVFPTYATGSLPSAAAFPAGYPINVTGLVPDPLRALADGIYWRRNDTFAVVT